MSQGIRRLLSATRDLFFPPRCVGCDELLPPFDKDTPVFCPVCRTAWENAVIPESSMPDGPIHLVAYRSGNTDGVPERVIYHMKHKGDPRVFAFVASRLSPRIAHVTAGEKLLFTYPPRRPSAVRRDGFDQAERLATALARVMNGESASLLRRRAASEEQKTLDAAERHDNAAHAYAPKKSTAHRVAGRTVVLCDDLCTTGATLSASAELIRAAGARRVILVTVARTAEQDT